MITFSCLVSLPEVRDLPFIVQDLLSPPSLARFSHVLPPFPLKWGSYLILNTSLKAGQADSSSVSSEEENKTVAWSGTCSLCCTAAHPQLRFTSPPGSTTAALAPSTQAHVQSRLEPRNLCTSPNCWIKKNISPTGTQEVGSRAPTRVRNPLQVRGTSALTEAGGPEPLTVTQGN